MAKPVKTADTVMRIPHDLVRALDKEVARRSKLAGATVTRTATLRAIIEKALSK